MSPINDLWEIHVGPLILEDAVELASRLLLGIGAQPTSDIVTEIIEQTSCIPYYIHAVVDQLRYRNDFDVAAVVKDCITKNTWQTDHYNARLDMYYGPDGARQARAILDYLATSKGAVDVESIRSRVNIDHSDLQLTRDDLLALLDKLEKDYYLIREGNEDRMSSPLLARIWRHHRRLL